MKKGLDQGINSDPVNARNRELSGFNGRVQGEEMNELTDPQKEKGSRRKREQTEEGADGRGSRHGRKEHMGGAARCAWRTE